MNIGTLTVTLGVISTDLDKLVPKLNTLAQRFRTFGYLTSTTLTLPMVMAGKAAINMAKDFEYSMQKIIGLAGVAQKSVDSWSKAILEMAPRVGKSPKELADALYFIASSGIKGAQALDVLEISAKAAESGLGETKTVADLLTSVLNAYAGSNMTAAKAADILVAAVREGKGEADAYASALGQLIPIAANLKVSFDQVAGAVAAITLTGSTAASAAVYLKGLFNVLLKAPPTAGKELAALGVMKTSYAELRKIMAEGPTGLINVMQKLRDLQMKYGDELISDVLPNIRALTAYMSIAGRNFQYNSTIMQKITNSSGSLAAAVAGVANTIKVRLDKALAEAQVSLIEFGKAIAPTILNILEDLIKKLDQLVKWWNSLTEEQQQHKLKILELMVVLGPLSLLLSTLMYTISGLASAVKLLISAFGLLTKRVVIGEILTTWAARFTAISTGATLATEAVGGTAAAIGVLATSIGSSLLILGAYGVALYGIYKGLKWIYDQGEKFAKKTAIGQAALDYKPPEEGLSAEINKLMYRNAGTEAKPHIVSRMKDMGIDDLKHTQVLYDQLIAIKKGRVVELEYIDRDELEKEQYVYTRRKAIQEKILELEKAKQSGRYSPIAIKVMSGGVTEFAKKPQAEIEAYEQNKIYDAQMKGIEREKKVLDLKNNIALAEEHIFNLQKSQSNPAFGVNPSDPRFSWKIGQFQNVINRANDSINVYIKNRRKEITADLEIGKAEIERLEQNKAAVDDWIKTIQAGDNALAAAQEKIKEVQKIWDDLSAGKEANKRMKSMLPTTFDEDKANLELFNSILERIAAEPGISILGKDVKNLIKDTNELNEKIEKANRSLEAFSGIIASIDMKKMLLGSSFDADTAKLEAYTKEVNDYTKILTTPNIAGIIVDPTPEQLIHLNNLVDLMKLYTRFKREDEDINMFNVLQSEADAFGGLAGKIEVVNFELQAAQKNLRDAFMEKVPISDERVKKLVDDIKQLKKTQVDLQNAQDLSYLNDMNNAIGNLSTNTALFEGKISTLQNSLKNLSENGGGTSDEFKDLAKQLQGLTVGQKVVEHLDDAFDQLFDSIMGGGKNMQEVLKNVFKSIVTDIIKTAAHVMILKAVMKAFDMKGTTSPINFSIFNVGNLVPDNSLIPHAANGLVVPPGFPNDTYPAYLTSGEIVMPPNKLLKAMEDLLSGRTKSLKIADNRTIDSITGKKVLDTSRLGGTIDTGFLNEVVQKSINRGMDPYTNLAIAHQETGGFNKEWMDNPFMVLLKNPDELAKFEKDRVGYSLDYIKEKMESAKKKGITDYATQIQAYNGLGKIDSGSFFGHNKAYGVTIPPEGINMKENPLYGKRVEDIRNNILLKNPDLVKVVEAIKEGKYHPEETNQTFKGLQEALKANKNRPTAPDYTGMGIGFMNRVVDQNYIGRTPMDHILKEKQTAGIKIHNFLSDMGTGVSTWGTQFRRPTAKEYQLGRGGWGGRAGLLAKSATWGMGNELMGGAVEKIPTAINALKNIPGITADAPELGFHALNKEHWFLKMIKDDKITPNEKYLLSTLALGNRVLPVINKTPLVNPIKDIAAKIMKQSSSVTRDIEDVLPVLIDKYPWLTKIKPIKNIYTGFARKEAGRVNKALEEKYFGYVGREPIEGRSLVDQYLFQNQPGFKEAGSDVLKIDFGPRFAKYKNAKYYMMEGGDHPHNSPISYPIEKEELKKILNIPHLAGEHPISKDWLNTFIFPKENVGGYVEEARKVGKKTIGISQDIWRFDNDYASDWAGMHKENNHSYTSFLAEKQAMILNKLGKAFYLVQNNPLIKDVNKAGSKIWKSKRIQDILPFPQEEIDTDLIRSNYVDEEIYKGNEWSKAWYNHPKTQERLDILRAKDPYGPDYSHWVDVMRNIKHEKYLAKPYYGDKPLMSAMGVDFYNGLSGYNLTGPGKGLENLVNPNIDIEDMASTAIHEGLHGIMGGNRSIPLKFQKALKDVMYRPLEVETSSKLEALRKTTLQDFSGLHLREQVEYLNQPTEIYARMMELRHAVDLRPGIVVTPNMMKDFMISGAHGGFPIDPAFFALIKYPDRFRNLMNTLPSLTVPGLIGGGLIAGGLAGGGTAQGASLPNNGLSSLYSKGNNNPKEYLDQPISQSETLKKLIEAMKASGTVPGFQHGGIVPSGYGNDTYPALLTSGEQVVPPGKVPVPDLSGLLKYNATLKETIQLTRELQSTTANLAKTNKQHTESVLKSTGAAKEQGSSFEKILGIADSLSSMVGKNGKISPSLGNISGGLNMLAANTKSGQKQGSMLNTLAHGANMVETGVKVVQTVKAITTAMKIAKAAKFLATFGPLLFLDKGGTVPGGYAHDTYPAMLSSGETVVPYDKMKPQNVEFAPVEFRIKENQLTGILQKANARKSAI